MPTIRLFNKNKKMQCVGFVLVTVARYGNCNHELSRKLYLLWMPDGYIFIAMETNELNKPGKTPLYEAVSLRIGEMIEKGTYRPGERIPSVRSLSRQMRISINTVIGAYAELERVGTIEVRPQSGYMSDLFIPSRNRDRRLK